MFVLDEGKAVTQLTFTSSNKSYQSRAYVNGYTPTSQTWYASGDMVPVKAGDVIYVAAGDPSWPSMGRGEATVYTIAVVDLSLIHILESGIRELGGERDAKKERKTDHRVCACLLHVVPALSTLPPHTLHQFPLPEFQ